MKLVTANLILLLCAAAAAGPPAAEPQRSVDLRAPHALENLQKYDPTAFKQIEEIVAGLRDKPDRAESNWLQASFNARDVDFSRLIYRTSLPPVQLLRFTLGDVRYTMYVTRTDVTGGISPIR